MSEIADRYRKVAAGFTQTAQAVPDSAWNKPAPPDGWVARDVVGHMVEWIPSFFLDSVGLDPPMGPSVDEDPAGAWKALNEAIQAGLDDPEVSAREVETRAGRHRFDDAVGTFCLGDVLVHTWDLARATGLDETLDPGEVRRLFEGMEPIDDILRESGQYGARVDVPEDADMQTKLIAFTGRQP
jgi:uncharacterized protein (TIGR03086 family)